MSARAASVPIVAASVALAALAALPACGAEDIELAASRPGPDASAAEGGGFDEDGSAPECDARSAPVACRPLGSACGIDGDCCSTHCAGDTCALPGTCAGAGVACTSRGDCCSGLCEPSARSTTLACLAECSPAQAPCVRASDCCDLGCNAGTCSGAECLREGSDCTADVQCCSNECSIRDGGGGGGASGKCVVDPIATCRGAGDDCSSGGPGGCCGVCGADGRCDPGPGPCRPLGAVCVTAMDCCRGAACADDGSGRTLCTAAPLPDGTSCVASFECASASCIGAGAPVCGPAPASCAVTGVSCTTPSQCCSGLCAANACQPSPCPTPH